MNESDERFLAIGNQSAQLLIEQGLGAADSILDVGCGYGRLAFGLLSQLDFKGRYEGFDVLQRQIDWCRKAITHNFQISGSFMSTLPTPVTTQRAPLSPPR
jgi:SAM-dependent methyltransferase